MTGYTKIFASILDSTIWRENDKTRLVWITMLAMANQWGDVEASVPGLADRARVTIEEAETALVTLQSSDKYSRTKDYDGKRIQPIDGGWRILNHGKYREKMSQDHRREYLRQKKQESRKRRQGNDPGVNSVSTNVNDGQLESTLSTQAEADSEAKESIQGAVVVEKPDGNPKPKPQTKAERILSQCAEATKTPIPILLNRADFISHWRTFCDHRTDLATHGRADGKKFDWTPRAAVRLLNKCEAMGPQKAIEAIEESLAKSYPDLYAPDENASQSSGRGYRELPDLPPRRPASL